MKKLLLFLFALQVTLFGSALGIVQKVHGIVKVKHKDSIKKEKVKQGYEIQSGDIISTFRKASAVLKLKDGSDVVLDQKAVIVFADALDVTQKEGKVFYKITKKDLKNKLKIKTDFAIIGIKGTTFIVNSDQNSSYVALKEGLIGIESVKAQFEHYKQKVMSEYEAYVKQQQQGFEKYKKQQEEYVVTMTKAFDLEAGNVVTFDGQKAIENKVQTEKEFAEFEKMLED